MAFEFTDDNVKDLIASGRPLIIDCWATWCGPCKKMSPAIDALAEKYADTIVVGKYNIEDQNDLATEYRVMSIPTLLFFKDGKNRPELRLVGAQSAESLEKQAEALLAL